MSEEIVRLLVEIDQSKVGPATVRMRQEFGAAVKSMDADSRRAAAGVATIGTGAEQASRIAVRSMKAVAAGIGAASAAAQASERAWLGLGATILTSFAAGGPIAGAFALVGAAVGVLTGETKQAEKAAREAGEAHAKWIEEAKSSAADLAGSLRDVNAELQAMSRRGAGEIVNARIVGLEMELLELEHQEEAIGRGVLKTGKRPTVTGLRDLIDSGSIPAENMERARAALEKLVALDERHSDILDLIDDLRALEVAKIREAASEEEKRAQAKARSSLVEDLGKVFADPFEKAFEEAAPHVSAIESMRLRMAGFTSEEIPFLIEINALEGKRARLEAEGTAEAREQLLLVNEDIKLLDLRLAVVRQLAAWDEKRTAEKKAQAEAEAKAKREAAEREAKAKEAAAATKSVEREIALLKASTDERRKMLEIEFAIEDLRERGVSEGLLGELRALRIGKIEAKAPVVNQFLASLQSTLSQGLTDLIVDGITNGFRNGTDIARQLVNTLLSQVLNSIISSGIQAAFSGLFSGGGGGLFGGGGVGIVSTIASAVTGGGGIGSNPFAGGLAESGVTGGTGGC